MSLFGIFGKGGDKPKTDSKISTGISAIFTGRKLDESTLGELEELLITADLGPAVAAEVIENFDKNRFGKDITIEDVKKELASAIAKILDPVAKPLPLDPSKKPQVIMVVGVNGNGKTTTIGKLAMKLKKQGRSVMFAACDTFRAAAASQLAVWAERVGGPLVTGPEGSDPGSVAYSALQQAQQQGSDVLIIDTAGRLQNKAGLMEELVKISRVLKKIDTDAPHETILVLDATTGQNALSQVEVFKQMVDVTGLIVTKLDGTAKGGILVTLAQKFQLPVYAIGIGEKVEDLIDFDSQKFTFALVGL